jgi:hypothetical protein
MKYRAMVTYYYANWDSFSVAEGMSQGEDDDLLACLPVIEAESPQMAMSMVAHPFYWGFEDDLLTDCEVNIYELDEDGDAIMINDDGDPSHLFLNV